MSPRRERLVSTFPFLTLRPAVALREALAEGYGPRELRADVLAGLVVGIVALPLSMALAIATGVPPQHGLYTAIVAGAVIGLLGGSRTQVSGPTASFVILAPIVARFGIGGLLLATVMAGLLLVGLGLLRMGRWIQFIPYPVTAGFTSAIALVIAALQLRDLLGLQVPALPDGWWARLYALAHALPTMRLEEFAFGIGTLVVLLTWSRLVRRIPAPLAALALGSLAAAAVAHLWPAHAVATIGTRFHHLDGGVLHAGIPRAPPVPMLPWLLGGPGGAPLVLSLELIERLLPSSFAIAMLGAIESLLSASVADGMAGTHHDPDVELVAQGVGNVVAPFFGGIAATGALARSATNVRSGGRSPIATIVHALFVLLAVYVLAPVLAWLPMASMAALLLVVAWNMSDAKHVLHVLRVAPRSDVAILLTCFTLTLVFDLVVGVTAGVLLASLLFMQRMADLAEVRVGSAHPALRERLPAGAVLFEVNGPLFFGAAHKALGALDGIADDARVVLLELSAVPTLDATGLVSLESALERLRKRETTLVLVGVQPQPRSLLDRGGVVEGPRLRYCATMAEAEGLAATLLAAANEAPRDRARDA